MTRKFLPVFILLIMVLLLFPLEARAQTDSRALVLTATGPLTPAMAEYLDRGLRKAQQEGSKLVVLQLDTPGGSIDLMNRMVQSIRSSEVPVVVYVTPRGAIAGSAGTILTLAGHAAAMAPETAIGAASPVGMQGDLNEVSETKAKEIIKASIRSLAQRRGEEAVELAEATVEDAVAVSAEEAFQAGLVDIVAEDLDDVFRRLDGMEVQMASGSKVLDLSGVEAVSFDPSFIERLLQTLTNPNIVFILLSIGVQAVLIEISSPGGWVAGFLGVVCLALGGYGLGVLPVNWFGLIFLLTSFVLFFLEVQSSTHGALAAAGIGSFITGSLVLFNSPGTPEFQRVSIPLIIGMAVLTAVGFASIITFALRAQARPAVTGAEGLAGKTGTTLSELNPEGTVVVAGEYWTAVLEPPDRRLKKGHRVRVVRVDGMRMIVQPHNEDI